MAKRNEIEDRYKWNIKLMYPDESKWEEDISECLALSEGFTSYRGRLTESSSTLLSALRELDDLGIRFENAFVYARMKRDEDNTVSWYR